MKKIISFLFVLALVYSSSAQPVKKLKQTAQLQMAKTADDDMPGTRGASVAWHPVQGKYYAAFAGNMSYPLCVFNMKGERLSDDEQTCYADVRGLWYNPDLKAIWGNGYDETGWFTYKLDKKGLPESLDQEKEGIYQPDPQSVGAYNPSAKQVLFLFAGKVYMYNKDGELADSLTISWGQTKKGNDAESIDDEEILEAYNYTSLIYTGIKGQELGFLQIETNTIELYNIKTGLLTAKLTLPDDAVSEASFNFAYTNGIYWLFDMEGRRWIGYK